MRKHRCTGLWCLHFRSIEHSWSCKLHTLLIEVKPDWQLATLAITHNAGDAGTDSVSGDSTDRAALLALVVEAVLTSVP